MTRYRAKVEDSSTSTSGLIHMHTHMPMYPNTYTHTMYTHMQYSTHKKREVEGGLSVGDLTVLWISRRGSSPSLWEGSKGQSLWRTDNRHIVCRATDAWQMWLAILCLVFPWLPTALFWADTISWNFSPFLFWFSKIYIDEFLYYFQWSETHKILRKSVTAYRYLYVTALGRCLICVLFLLVSVFREPSSFMSRVTGISGPASDRIWPSEQCGLAHTQESLFVAPALLSKLALVLPICTNYWLHLLFHFPF